MAKKRHHKSLRHISNSTPNKSLNYLSTPDPNPTVNISANWLFSGCKHPRTLSFDTSFHSLRADVGAGGADVDGIMTYSFGPTEESPRLTDLSPGSLRASTRFFVAPAATGSLIEEARLSGAAAADVLATCSRSTPAELVMRGDKLLNKELCGEPMKGGHDKVYKSFSNVATAGAKLIPCVAVPCGAVAAVAYSDDPCADFRASMMEMVAAAHRVQQRGAPLDDYWGFMEELLFCYLELNERSVYKYIFRAFADVAENRSPEHRRRIPVDDVD